MIVRSRRSVMLCFSSSGHAPHGARRRDGGAATALGCCTTVRSGSSLIANITDLGGIGRRRHDSPPFIHSSVLLASLVLSPSHRVVPRPSPLHRRSRATSYSPPTSSICPVPALPGFAPT